MTLIMVIGSCFATLFLGAWIPALIVDSRVNKRVRLANKALRGTVFSPTTKTKPIEAAKSKSAPKAIEAPAEPQVSSSQKLKNIIQMSDLKGDLRKHHLNVIAEFEMISKLTELTVEQEHDLEVVYESVIDCVRTFQALTPSQRISPEAVENIEAQLVILENVLSTIKKDYEEEAMRNIKNNRAFLEQKYSSEQ